MTHHDKPARGILRSAQQAPFTHTRHAPEPDLEGLIEFFWGVQWELEAGERISQRVLSHPSVHIVWEPDRLYVSGIPSACFARTLEGRGDVFSAKILPGHASRLLPESAKCYTDQERPLDALFEPHHIRALHIAIATSQDARARQTHLSAFLRSHATPARTEHVFCEQVTRWIEATPEAWRVQDVCAHFDEHPRMLQRLFAEHVGVSPKWIIGRYRMHEAAMRLESGASCSLTELAHELGYFDQAHFTRDFKRMTGQTPSAYRAHSS